MPSMLLQPPRAGTSRFSKALPAVPGQDGDDMLRDMDMGLDAGHEYDSPPSPPSKKSLPDLPTPLPLPPRKDSIAHRKPHNPLNALNNNALNPVKTTSLPPLPLLKTANSPPSAPPRMAIPRRPVGQPAQLQQQRQEQSPPEQEQEKQQIQPQPKPQPQQQQQQQYLQAPLLLSPMAPTSPSDSFSSILSAYDDSRTSGESLVRSSAYESASVSAGATSARESEVEANTYYNSTSPSHAATLPSNQPATQVMAARTDSLLPTAATANWNANEELPRELPRERALPRTQPAEPEPRTQNVAPAAEVPAPEAPELKPTSLVNDQPQPQQPHHLPRPPPPPPIPSKDDKYHHLLSLRAPPPPPAALALPSTPKPPPPPPKTTTTTTTPTQQHPVDSSFSSPSSSSPPRPQIWRRRSVKAELSLELPDLKLASSHGSTAATQHPAQSTRPPQSHLPPAVAKLSSLPTQPPRSSGGLPGRDIRPVPSQEHVSETRAMGHSTSKLKNLKDKFHSLHRKTDSSNTVTEPAARPSAQRPPTPEYQRQDVKTPIVDSFISPVSPASSPEPPAPAEVSPEIPQAHSRQTSISAADVQSKPVARKALPQPPQDPSPQDQYQTPRELAAVRAQPDLAVTTHFPTVGSVPHASPDAFGNRTSAGSAASSRTYQSAEAAKFPPRKSSNAHRAFEPPRQPAVELDPRLVQSESQGLLYKGRDGTLYPEMKVSRDPDPRAFYFPSQLDENYSQGAVIRAPPLKDSHYNCYHGHRTMNRRTNRNYPLTCQTCERADSDDRWACTFCHLRICDSCMRILNTHQRDLHRFAEQMRKTGWPAQDA
ncbi:hypothetical protein G7046_g9932 [Stylonectria norvegica]|nr:hypothetical protein G7046_g9932 [Stylonectria norvegica]